MNTSTWAALAVILTTGCGKEGTQGPQGPEGPQGPAGELTGPAGGDLDGDYPDPVIAAGAVSTDKLADAAVTVEKVDPTGVQRRISGMCDPGQYMTGVNEDGTVACSTPGGGAAQLECIATPLDSFTIAASSVNFFNNPDCPAGYQSTTPYCWTADAGVYLQGSGLNANDPANPSFCAWENTTGSNKAVYGGSICCRVAP